jgi:hypothetical protein
MGKAPVKRKSKIDRNVLLQDYEQNRDLYQKEGALK